VLVTLLSLVAGLDTLVAAVLVDLELLQGLL
jgi:hypothetical protein